MKEMNIVIISPHYDDEFYAYIALKKLFKEKIHKHKIDVIFLTDSKSTKYLKNEYLKNNIKLYSFLRKRESESFCHAYNIVPKIHLMLDDKKLFNVENHRVVNFAMEIMLNKYDIVIAPASNEHEDHDIAHYCAKNNSKNCLFYTVHAKNSDGIRNYKPYSEERFNILVRMFYFWYPTQKSNYFPSIYGGFFKD
jgi:LmbE family N-acetylglucosaminyl deacetylase